MQSFFLKLIAVGGVVSTAAIAVPLPTRGTAVARAFAQITRDREQSDWQHLGAAFHLPELSTRSALWRGPFSRTDLPRFMTYYAPPRSDLGIKDILLVWQIGLPGRGSGSLTLRRTLRIRVRPDACPTPAEMSAATGVPEDHFTLQGSDGGPDQNVKVFHMKDQAGKSISIFYAPERDCELSSSDDSI